MDSSRMPSSTKKSPSQSKPARRKLSSSPSSAKRGATSHWSDKLFSPNSEKAWAERFFLKYSLVWPVLFGVWSTSGLHLRVGDFGNMLATVVIAAPNVVVPLLYSPPQPHKPVWETFWFKYLWWIFIYSFVATYFWTEYFFDVLGMKYQFPHLSWNFDSVLVGTGKQRVPLMMLLHGWYFFVTYHTCSIVFIRFIRNAETFKQLVPSSTLRSIIATGASSLFFAWAEIKFTTMDAIKDQFAYGDMDWALSWGAGIYSCYFLASFPFVQHLDEMRNDWTLWRTTENALAAAMLGFIILDLFCQFVVPGQWVGKAWFS